MEISEGHARELAKQAQRKASLRSECEQLLAPEERIVFEAGCGHGHWLTAYAEANPEQTCIGIDLINHRIRKGKEKCKKRGLHNLHFYKAELGEFLEVLPAGIRFDLTVLLFPDPWPKARHHRRRMIQTEFLTAVAARTDPGGRFCFRSDDLPYYEWTREHLDAHAEWGMSVSAASSSEWPFEMETYFQKMMGQYYSVVARRLPHSGVRVDPAKS